MPQTTRVDPPQPRKVDSDGSKLLMAAGALFVSALAMLFVSATPYTILVSILALIVGLTGFRQLEIENKPEDKPEYIPDVFEVDLLSAVMSSGAELHVYLEITFSPAPGPPHALERIKNRLLRALNIYVPKIRSVSNDLFGELEGLFEKEIEPLCKELCLDQITIRTLDVKSQGTDKKPGSFSDEG